MCKAGADPPHPSIIEDDPANVPAKGWAEMIRKVYEIDPLLCPSCRGRMSVVSFVEEPKTIDRIIRHLEMTFEAERPPPPRVVQQHLLMTADEAADNTALKHVAEPEEIATAALYLASEASSNMTGETLVLDGGRFCSVRELLKGLEKKA